MKDIRLLQANEIDVRVGAVSKKGDSATLLLYKDARVDMALLDEIFGIGNWQSEYFEIKGTLYCKIGVRASATAKGDEQPLPINEFVWKSSNGVESQGTGEDDPNNIKGEASDAFKRAGFMWGIGRELYEWKDIRIGYDKERDKYERYSIQKIEYDKNRQPLTLVITNKKGDVVYKFENGSKKWLTTKEEPTPNADTQKEENARVENPSGSQEHSKATEADNVDYQALIKMANRDIYSQITSLLGNLANGIKATQEEYEHAQRFGITNFFKEIYKLPLVDGKLATLELSYTERPPYVKGNVVVVFNDDFKKRFESFMKTSEFMPI